MENYLRYNNGVDVLDVMKDRMGEDITRLVMGYSRTPTAYLEDLKGFFASIVECAKQDLRKIKFEGHGVERICNVLKKSRRNREYRVMGAVFQVGPTVKNNGDVRTKATCRLFSSARLPISWQYQDQYTILAKGPKRKRVEEVRALMEYSKVHRTMLCFKEEWEKPRRQTWKKRILKEMKVKGYSKLTSNNDKEFLSKVMYRDDLEEYVETIDVKPKHRLSIYDQLCYIWSS
jgi:hypothetical protein